MCNGVDEYNCFVVILDFRIQIMKSLYFSAISFTEVATKYFGYFELFLGF